MNSSKIIFPSQFVTDLYYYYSYVTLFLTWLISPFVVYTILTQSKNLQSFKWLILNHTFWCLMFETLISVVKPLFLAPAPGGFPIGWIKDNGSFFKTTIATLLGFTFGINCVVGLAITVGCRYLIVFPSAISKFTNVRNFMIIGGSFTAILYICVAGVGFLTLSVDAETVHKWAVEYDRFFINLNEPSLFFCPMYYIKPFIIFVYVCMILLIIIGIFVTAFFVHIVKTLPKTTTVTKIQRSLITSSIMHIILTITFLQAPLTIIFGNGVFEIPYTATLATYCWVFVATHSLIELITTVIFVSPYRKFLNNIFYKIFRCFAPPQIHLMPVSFNTSSSMATRNMNIGRR